MFDELFAQIGEAAVAAPHLHVEEGTEMGPGTVFLVWEAPEAMPSIARAVDGFIFDDDNMIVSQYIYVTESLEFARRARRRLQEEGSEAMPESGMMTPVAASWDNHFNAFGAQDVSMILEDYTEDSAVQVFQEDTQTVDYFYGLAGVEELFTNLFADLWSYDTLAAPQLTVVEDYPGSVFLIWETPEVGVTRAADVFAFSRDGKIYRQYIYSNFVAIEEPTCDCVAEDDFDALVDHVSMQAEEIAALQEELAALDAASLEATVNDVDSELSMLSACVASVMDGTYVEPEPMSSSPTTPSMTLK